MSEKKSSGGPIRPALEGPRNEYGIVFVHGLGGSPDTTWGPMLNLISGDAAFNRATLDCYSYPTRLINVPWLAPPPGLRQIAEGLRTFLNDRFDGYRRIDLVTHSLGGVVVRTFLVDEIRRASSLPIKKVALIAVPNAGSSLASVGKQVSYKHAQIRALCKNSTEVEQIEEQWKELRVAERIDVRYFTGGQDRCVPQESACLDSNAIPSVLIHADHRNIVVPFDREDNRYSILARFLLSSYNGNASPIRPADPLFEQYKLEHEPYYVARSFDSALSTAVSAGHVWLCGKSGVGKSVALRRAVLRKGWAAFQVNLSSYEDRSPLGMIFALTDELSILVSNSPAELTERSFEVACRSIRSSLAHLCAEHICGFIVEEIPLDESGLLEFLEYSSRLLQIINSVERIRDRVAFLFSSIADLSGDDVVISGKVREGIQIISDPDWISDDLKSLTRLLSESLAMPISAAELEEICAAAGGRPRFVKLLFRYYRNANDRGKTLAALLERVRSEQV